MIIRKYPTNYSIYEPVYGTDFPAEQLFLIEFDLLPSRYENSDKHYNAEILDYLRSLGFVDKIKLFSNGKRYTKSNDVLMVDDMKRIFVKCYTKSSEIENEKYIKLEFLYSLFNGEIEKQIDFSQLEKFEKVKTKSNINLVKSEMGHLDTEEFNLSIPDINLDYNYGSDFKRIHEVIVNKLNKPYGKGIILLHGDPGTGKTSYIKYLTSLITDKEVLFVAPSMAEMISEPSIIPFLMEHKNTILIIEDAERVIGDREVNGSPSGVSNILNLTDGILGDCLAIQIIATFNMKRERIDQALLRKGRLIAEHKFDKLNVDDTNKLLKHLEKDFISTEPMSLADIYNVDVEVFKSNKKNKIGLI